MTILYTCNINGANPIRYYFIAAILTINTYTILNGKIRAVVQTV